MSEQPIDWDNYQVPVDPSVPNPVAPTKSNWHGRGAGGVGLRPDLQLVPLGGGYRTSRRRLVCLGMAALGGMVTGVGLVLPWSVTLDFEGAQRITVPYSYWRDYPTGCGAVVFVAVASLALLCAHRARFLVTLLNLMAALVIVISTAQTQSTNATLNAVTAPQTLHLLGIGWLTLFGGVVLNLVASVVQPPPP